MTIPKGEDGNLLICRAVTCRQVSRLHNRTGRWWGEFVPWNQQFFDPIMVPGRKPLATLRDAAQYIMKLPKAEQQATPWQTAAEVLVLVGEHGLR
jgi:hypothetical protein